MHIPGFAIWIGLAVAVGYFGKERKFGFWGNFAVAMLLTPLVGVLVLFASDKKECCEKKAEVVSA